MKDKIIFAAVILGILCLFEPNFHFVQKFFMFNNKPPKRVNRVDLSLYRNNPSQYFAYLKEKQKQNANNFSAEYETKDSFTVYFRKNKIQKEVTITKINPEFGGSYSQLINGRNNYYIDNLKIKKSLGFILKLATPKKQKPYLPAAIYDIPNVNDSDILRYKHQTYFAGKNICSIWESYSRKTTTSKVTGRTSTSIVGKEYCFDENLGISYYTRVLNTDNNADYLYKVNKLGVGKVTDKDILLPKEAKISVNLAFLGIENLDFNKKKNKNKKAKK